MALTLYHSPGSRSSRIRWLLEELELDYAVELVPREARSSKDYRRRHPFGRVPALETDEGVIFETAAICLHVAEMHPAAGLIPSEGSYARAQVYQWISVGLTEVEPHVAEARRSAETDPDRAEAARDHVLAAVAVVDRALNGRDYLVGGRFTVADLLCGSSLFGARRLELTSDAPALDGYLERLEARPARRRAYADTA